MKFVVIEGTDAAGKATQTKMLVEALQAKNKTVRTFSCPDYDNVTGKLIKTALKGEQKLDNLTLQMLFAANRYEFIPTFIENCKKDNVDYIIADRYIISSIIYADAYASTYGGDRFGQFIKVINNRLPEPDVTFLLDISISESFRRRPQRRDAFELDEKFLENVRLEYLSYFSNDASGKLFVVSCTPVQEQSKSVTVVHNEILEVLRQENVI
jgi:dTMP kinase